MTDVFISYAREDRKFVQRLHDALAHEGRESWVDWEGIPASAKWMAEVRAAIDEADCFCFVVSPDSVESPVCREEAAHAAASNKRILPLLHREVADGLVPETVAAHNWIEFDGTAGFDRAFATLVKALETEPEHLRAHTRLLVRSKEWEGSQRDRSHLLRGQDLSQAEAWLSTSGGKEPAPTQGQTAYVLASRKAASRRQRTVVGAVAIALVLSLVLSAVAIVQRGEAEDQRRAAEEAQAAAERQAQVANSRALAAQALVHLDRDLELAVLLSLEAYRTAPTEEALDVLHIAAQRSHMIERTLTAGSSAGEAEFTQKGRKPVAFSPDGELIASGDAEGNVVVWSADSGELVGRPISVSSEGIFAIAFSSSGILAAGGADGEVTQWDPRNGMQSAPPIHVTDPVSALSFGLGGEVLAVGTRAGDVTLLRAADGRALAGPTLFGRGGLSGQFRTISGLAFSPDDEHLAIGVERGDLFLVAADSLEGRRQLETNARTLFSPEFSPDGRTVAAGILNPETGDGDVLVWGAGSLGLLQRLEGHGDNVFDVSFSPNGRVLASASADASVRLWDLTTGEQIGEPLLGHSDDVHTLAFDPTGTDLVSASTDGSVILWDAGSRLVGGGGPVNVVAFANDGSRLLSTEPFSYAEPLPPDPAFDGGGDIIRWDTTTWTPIGEPIHGEYVIGMTVGPDGTWLAGGTVDGRVLRWPTDGDSAVGEALAVADDVLFGMTAVSPDEGIVVSGGFDQIHLWDLTTGDALSPLPGYGNLVYGLAFSPDGNTLATGDWEGRVRLWDTGSWEPIEDPLAEGLQQVYAVAFDPTGSRLAAAGFDGSVIVWDTATWGRVRELTIDDAVLSVAFSPNGRVLAAGSEAGEVHFVDMETGELIGGPVSGQRDWVNSVTFAPDGETLVAGSEDGSIALIPSTTWTDDIAAVAEHLCSVAGRGMSEAEWGEFVNFKPYEPGCPRLGASS